MMKKNNFKRLFFISLIGCVIMVACKESPKEISNISFDPNAETRSIFETGIIKDVELIRLESDSCTLGPIDKIICKDSLLYLLDRNITKSVYIFTTKGKFVNKISKHGHGKYEYIQLWDIFFDQNNQLCLLSRLDQKIIAFSPDGKRILGERKLPKMFSHIMPTTNGYVGYMLNYSQDSNLPYNVWTMDKDFNLLEGFSPISPNLESCYNAQVNTMSGYGEAMYFKPEYTNTIYQIKDGEMSERYHLDFGEKTFPDLSTISRENEREWMILTMQKVANVYHYAETEDNLLLDFIMDGQDYMGIYDKSSRTTEIADLDSYVDEFVFSFGTIRGMDESAIYSVVDYEGVYSMWVGHNQYNDFEKLYPKQVSNLRKLYPQMQETGNPFIVRYSLKE